MIIASHPLFLASIGRLLKHPGIEIIAALSDKPESAGRILELQPEIVIWEGEPEDIEHKALQILEKAQHKLRVIRMNSIDNSVNVYAAELGTINSTQELLQMILS